MLVVVFKGTSPSRPTGCGDAAAALRPTALAGTGKTRR